MGNPSGKPNPQSKASAGQRPVTPPKGAVARKSPQAAGGAAAATRQRSLERTLPVEEEGVDTNAASLVNAGHRSAAADDSMSDSSSDDQLAETQAELPSEDRRVDQERTQALEEQDEEVPEDRTQVYDQGASDHEVRVEDRTVALNERASAASAGVKPPAAPQPLQKNVVGDYRLLKKLGQGGMGTVYKAHQISLDRDVALKVLSRDAAAKNPSLVQRFQREARMMAKLDHPNILRCYEVNQFHGIHYLTMEFVDGGSLHDWLTKLGRLQVGDALHVTLACAHALEHAHELQMIHRDIKPENILVTRKGVIKVADLGLAKARDENLDLTRTGTGAGTPVFMAPEQAKDVKHVDHRSDIYALGCMLYNLLTGEAPFKGETLLELFEAKHKGTHRNTRDFNPEIPARLDLIIDKMLAAKPEHRFQSCAEVIQALEALELADDCLSFIPGAAAATLRKVAPAASQAPTPPASKPAAAKAVSRPAPADEPTEEFWYVKLEDEDGSIAIKRLSEETLIGMIRLGSVSANTQASRTYKNGYRNLATFSQFTSLLQAKAITKKADRKAEKFRGLYAKIEKDAKWRDRKRWFNSIFASMGSLVGAIVWIVIVLGIAGLAYLFLTEGFNDVMRRIGFGR